MLMSSHLLNLHYYYKLVHTRSVKKLLAESSKFENLCFLIQITVDLRKLRLKKDARCKKLCRPFFIREYFQSEIYSFKEKTQN